MKRMFLFLIVFSMQFIKAQQQQDLQRANHLFDKTYYSDAILLYEKVRTENQTLEVIRNLGDCYYFNNENDKAQEQYHILIQNYGKDLAEEYYFRYAQTLKANGDYDKANKVMRDYLVTQNNTDALIKFDKNLHSLKNVSAIGERFEIRNLAINTPNSEFGAVVFGDNLVFATVKKKPNVFNKTYKWNNESYLNLVTIPLRNIHAKDSIVTYFSKKLKSPMHESNAVFTADGKTMYFTRNNSKKGRRKKNKDKVSTVEIFKAEFVDGQWTNIKALPFNNENYSVEHPALSSDEKTLYFASDMPGTFGSLDIFSVAIKGSTYGTPINLGNKINTDKREQFPFVSSDNKLYFSSDRHEGYGSLDVFVADIQKDSYSNPLNVGLPVNSGYDDFAFYIDSETKAGYFSSNRLGGKGKDDIYSLKETAPLNVEDCKQYIFGIITDIDTHLTLENVIVVLKNEENFETKKIKTTADGKFNFSVECEKKYSITATKESYSENSKSFNISAQRNKTNDGSMGIRSIKKIEEEEQMALKQKKITDEIALNQKKKNDAMERETKRLANLALARQLKKEKIEKEKKERELAIIREKQKIEAIVATEKDVIKDKNRLLIKTAPIYFDYNMWYIRKESKIILNRVVELMKKYPDMIVEIGSHTDNRGNEKFNLDLSQKRADATRTYIITEGIPKNRIIAKGYGESVQIIKCLPEESCNEEQHELNRRSEFVIKKL